MQDTRERGGNPAGQAEDARVDLEGRAGRCPVVERCSGAALSVREGLAGREGEGGVCGSLGASCG